MSEGNIKNENVIDSNKIGEDTKIDPSMIVDAMNVLNDLPKSMEVSDEQSLPDPDEVKMKIDQKKLDELKLKFDKAVEFATKCHEGQKDLVGEDYINHPLRVAKKIMKDDFLPTVMKKPRRIRLMIEAMLHDVVKDCGVKIEDIEEIYGIEIAEAIGALTKLEKEDYVDYILRLVKNDDAIFVKYFDLEDNMDIFRFTDRGIDLVEKDLKRLNKYGDAHLFLKRKIFQLDR